jgi:hypothetical protein
MLRRDGFSLAEDRYGIWPFLQLSHRIGIDFRVGTASYKPILDEVQKILAEAGLDEEEMKRVGGSGKAGDAGNRNRR